ncbi:LOW QUALITY PROTEIN: uncharacterized protein LOC128136615, partial [Harpia harpyja]|uniref:LOW QUALITY PROTEIN: uncharacterized protein LOC128136615 n=1 Tax=Harpia harpyja TaxID=202280 RepID=UPI0022B08997
VAAAVAASPLAAGRGAGSRPSPRRPGQPRPLPAAPGAAGAAGDCLPLVAVRRRPAGTAETCGCGEKGVSAGCPRREPQPPGVSLTARRRWRAATQSCPGVLGSPRGKRPVRLQGGRQRHFQSSPVPLALLLPSPGWEKGGRPRKQVKRRKEVSGSAAVEEMVKRRRVEVGAEASCPQSGMGRTGAERVCHMSKAKHGFETNSSKEDEREFSPASLTVGCNRVSLWAPVGSNLEQRTGTGQAEGAVQLLQQLDQMVNKGNVESEGRGLSRFWRRCNIPRKWSSSELSLGKKLLRGGLLTSVTALIGCGFYQLRSATSSPVSKGLLHTPFSRGLPGRDLQSP